MQAQMGSATMCEIHKDGQVTGGLKYEEGRLVVYGDLIRAAKQLDSADDFPATVTAMQAKWEKQLARYQSQTPRSMPWVAYSQGGVDTLHEVLLRYSPLED